MIAGNGPRVITGAYADACAQTDAIGKEVIDVVIYNLVIGIGNCSRGTNRENTI